MPSDAYLDLDPLMGDGRQIKGEQKFNNLNRLLSLEKLIYMEHPLSQEVNFIF